MDFSRCCPTIRLLLLLPLLAGGLTGCRKKTMESAESPATIAPELLSNGLGNLPGAIYRSESGSQIHWQPWSRETFERAGKAKRLVFAVIVLPQQPSFGRVLDFIERDPEAIRTINDKYVPVLVDGDAVREFGLLSAQLAAEVKQSVDMPMFVWMTQDMNPVAWVPVSNKTREGIMKMFTQSSTMVDRMWQDDPSYVLKNSALDNETRSLRIRSAPGGGDVTGETAADELQAIRQLISLYDPYSRTMDEAGGLFPVGVLDVLTAAPLLPGVPEPQRRKSLETLRELMTDLVPSAIFDPLEGGVFAGRVSPSWALPSFILNAPDQPRVASILLRSYRATGDPVALERALGLLAFAERNFRTEDGLFSMGGFVDPTNESWLWHVEDIERTLPPEDAKWWIAATGMKPMGNLPSESDPKRELFRLNSLALLKPLEQTAAQLSVPPAEFKARFEQSRTKLAALRKERLKSSFPDSTPHAVTNFRMISAYAEAYGVTGDEQYRGKATELLAKAKQKFSQGDRLNIYGTTGDAPTAEARAFVYGLAMQAAQDVVDITSDPAVGDWIARLAATSGRIFFADGVFSETSKEASLLNLAVQDRRRIFDDTTVGVFALESARQAPFAGPASVSLKPMVYELPPLAVSRPIVMTDRIVAALVRDHSKVVMYGKDLPAEMRAAVERLPLQLFPRGPAKDSDGVPAGSVRVVSSDGAVKLVSTPSQLLQELLLAGQKP